MSNNGSKRVPEEGEANNTKKSAANAISHPIGFFLNETVFHIAKDAAINLAPRLYES